MPSAKSVSFLVGTSVIGGIADTTAPHGNNNGDMLDKQIQLDPILIEEHEKPGRHKSDSKRDWFHKM